MSAEAFATVIRASASDRLDLFLATVNLLGAPVGNVEKGFLGLLDAGRALSAVPRWRPRYRELRPLWEIWPECLDVRDEAQSCH